MASRDASASSTWPRSEPDSLYATGKVSRTGRRCGRFRSYERRPRPLLGCRHADENHRQRNVGPTMALPKRMWIGHRAGRGFSLSELPLVFATLEYGFQIDFPVTRMN